MTLVELLAALLVSGFVVAMAGRIFLSGHAQFVKRSAESERLGILYRLKAEVRGALRDDIARCQGGGLWIKQGDAEADLQAFLKKRSPGLQDADFRCLEPAADGASLQEWTDGAQPRMVEYRLRVKTRGVLDTLAGSWIR
jgi:type II secretory pathway pseudopilin PulG